ncbi:MAG: thiamine phosphate synthase [Bryobacteraceae bacterium]|nr:thiamine phosphate synthase [Bryobacteraceae bacterium]
MDQALTLPRLYAIADTATLHSRGMGLIATVEQWLEAGVRLIQLRHKGQYTRELYQTAAALCEKCQQRGALFVIDDRADIAALLGAGLHVGQDDLSPADARRVIGPDALLGLSTHNEDQLAAGDREPVDYLAVGPVFQTASKENPDPVLGLERVARMRGLTSKPLVAIGGITRASAPALWTAGIDSVAVISDLLPAAAGNWVRLVTDVL